MCVCAGTHVRGSRLCDALRNVCLPVGLSHGVPATTNAANEGAFARVCMCVRGHLSLPNVLGCKAIQVHDSNVTPLLLLSFCLPLFHTNSHFQLILSTASSVFHPYWRQWLFTFFSLFVIGTHTHTHTEQSVPTIYLHRRSLLYCLTWSGVCIYVVGGRNEQHTPQPQILP